MAATSDAGRTPNELTMRELEPFITRGANSQEQQSRCTIFKVGKRERERNPEHFQHDVISLGLYDRSSSGSSNPKLPGDEFRLEIVGTLLRELGKEVGDWNEICREVVQKPEEMRQLYDEVGSDLGVEAVRNVLTLDALFLACFLGTYFDYSLLDFDYILKMRPTYFNYNLRSMFGPVYEMVNRKGTKFCNRLLIDILKLENQIPLALIGSALEFMIVHRGDKTAGRTTGHQPRVSGGTGEEVQPRNESRQGDNVPVQLTTERNQVEEERGAKVQLCNEISDYVTVPINAEGNEAEEKRRDEVQTQVTKVLTDICRGFVHHHEGSLPFEGRFSWNASNRFEGSAHLLDSLYGCTRVELLSHFGERREDETTKKDLTTLRLFSMGNERTMPSATKLHEAGIDCRGRSPYVVKFKKMVKFKVSLFKANFFLPQIINIGRESELLWRNLLAYEDGRDGNSKILISYFHFMDLLINTERDVVLLTTGKCPVIAQNNLGSEEAVAKLYNSLLSNYKLHNISVYAILYDPDGHHNRAYRLKWILVTKKILAFCDNKLRQKLVEFGRTYLSKAMAHHFRPSCRCPPCFNFIASSVWHFVVHP